MRVGHLSIAGISARDVFPPDEKRFQGAHYQQTLQVLRLPGDYLQAPSNSIEGLRKYLAAKEDVSQSFWWTKEGHTTR